VTEVSQKGRRNGSVGKEGDGEPKKRTRTARAFPAATFEDSLVIGRAIQEHGAGRQIRRLTLFDAMGRVPDSSASRQFITNSGKYGITTGSYSAEHLDLTEIGRIATSLDSSPVDRAQACFELAIKRISIFEKLYEHFKDNKLPAINVLRDVAAENGIPEDLTQECVDTFVVNCKYVGVLKSLAGAERFITFEHALEEIRKSTGVQDAPVEADVVFMPPPASSAVAIAQVSTSVSVVTSLEEFDSACFYISPIGDEASEFRKHSDLFMGTFIEPVLSQFDLRLIRADKINEAGMITSQMIEYIARSKLVIADLSFHNPNVFYEVALRHAIRKPIVQLIRRADRVPFDVQPFRTIMIDTTDIYSLVPQIDVYRAEIAAQVRKSLDSAALPDNPLSIFYPGFWSQLNAQ
jgi:hypothetical protein